MELQPKQFGVPIQGLPEGNPHLSRKTQREAGLIGREDFYPYAPGAAKEEQSKPLLSQRGGDYFKGMPARNFDEALDVYGRSLGVLQDPKPEQPQLFEPAPARPQDQTPDQWLRRPDVMFHTGLTQDQPFEENLRTHFGTAAAGRQIYEGAMNRDVVARRIPGAKDMPSAMDQGDQRWNVSLAVQYENRHEDEGSMSVYAPGKRTRSWVDDQLESSFANRGRFSDYAQQMRMNAQLKQDNWDPDTSFRLNANRASRDLAEHEGDPLPSPDAYKQARLSPTDHPDDQRNWRDIWNEALRPSRVRP